MFDLIKMVVKIRKRLLFILATLFFGASSFIIYFIEPDNFQNPFIGFWWVMTTVTTIGFGDFVPETTLGRLFGLFLYLSGIGLIGIVIGKIVEAFGLYQKLKEEGKLSYKGKNHFIIVGWSMKSQKTIQELLISQADADVVLIDKVDKSPADYDRFFFIHGDPTSPDILLKANIFEAKSVCIFSADPIFDENQTDGKTLLIASAIENFAKQHNKEIYTIVEIIREKHIPNFKHANVDEFVLSNEAFSDLMAKSAIHKGSTKLFMQLLSRSYGDDIWEVEKHPSWHTYNDAFEGLKRLGAVLISDHKDLGIVRKLHEKIPSNAKLFVICDKETYKNINKIYVDI